MVSCVCPWLINQSHISVPIQLTNLLLCYVLFILQAQIQSTSDRVQYNDLQSLLCATLQSVLRKVQEADAPQISDRIMEALLRMMTSANGKSGGVQEDALLAVSTLVEGGWNFYPPSNFFLCKVWNRHKNVPFMVKKIWYLCHLFVSTHHAKLLTAKFISGGEDS